MSHNNLQEVRQREGLAIIALAALSKVSDKTISSIERGLREARVETKYKIVNGLNSNPDKTQQYQFNEVFPNG